MSDANLKGEMLLVYYSAFLDLLVKFDRNKKGNKFSISGDGAAFEAIVEFARQGAGPVQFSVSYYSEMGPARVQEYLTVTGVGRRGFSTSMSSNSVVRTEAALAFRIKDRVLSLARALETVEIRTIEMAQLEELQNDMRTLLTDCM